LVVHCFESRKWTKILEDVAHDEIDYEDQDLIKPKEHKQSIIIYNPPPAVLNSVTFQDITEVVIQYLVVELGVNLIFAETMH